MTPGITKMKSGSTLRKPPKIAPRRALSPFFAASTRWTMNWSVHQYQTPRIGAPSRMPVHGKLGSVTGFHMSKNVLPAPAYRPLQPPTASSPMNRTTADPPTNTKACSMSV